MFNTEMEGACLPVGKHTTYDQAQAMRGDVSEMSVEQYMSFVRDEAQSLPLVGRVEHVEETIQHHQQSLYMPTVEKVDECDPTFLPDEEWVSETLYTFSELRRTISQMAEHQGNKERVVKVPPMKHRKSWKQFCFGVAPDTLTKEAKDTRMVEDNMGINQEGEEKVQGTLSGRSSDNSSMMLENVETEPDLKLAKKRKSMVGTEGGDEDGSLLQSKRILAARMGLDDSQFSESYTESINKIFDESATTVPPPSTPAPALVDGDWKGPVKQIPTPPLLLQFDQVLTQHLLSMHCDWLEIAEVKSAGSNEGDTETTALETRGHWLYCLLARLEKPVYHEAAAVIRRLYRRSCALRASLDKASSSFDSDLATLNVLVSIAGTYFGQSEQNSNICFDDDDEDDEEDDEEEDEEEEEEGVEDEDDGEART